MQCPLPYGETVIPLEVPDNELLGIFEAARGAPLRDVEREVRSALRSPIGSPRLGELLEGSETVALIVNDITRPAPSREMVSAVTRQLAHAGISDDRVRIVVATGTHRANTLSELEGMLGSETMRRFEVVNHDCRDDANLVFLGETSGGLPVWINRMVAEADLRILTGVIAPHHTAGYSGGRKSLIPGVSGLETLRTHHALPIRPFHPAIGWMEGNPFHEQALEAAQMVGRSVILNAVQNGYKETVAVVAGDMEQAHRQGVKICERLSAVDVGQGADIVITSPGGYPRDINLYQAQKAVSAAEGFVRKGGVIILAAECRDGLERSEFTDWMCEAKSPQEVVERFRREGFRPGSNKAFMFARALLRADVVIVSEHLPRRLLSDMFIECVTSVEEALDRARKILRSRGPVEPTTSAADSSGLLDAVRDVRIAVLPRAAGLVPRRAAGAR